MQKTKTTELLELSLLQFFQGFRRVYIGDQAMSSSKVCYRWRVLLFSFFLFVLLFFKKLPSFILTICVHAHVYLSARACLRVHFWVCIFGVM